MTRDLERVSKGGLMRCCLETLREDIEQLRPDHRTTQGEILRCKWCRAGMVFKGDTWRWEGPRNV